jgi:hypothetical protein
MPYPTEHAARIKQPGSFQADSFRRVTLATGISAIMGKLKGSSSMTLQAYRFDRKKFTAAQAKKWLADHKVKPILFEPASNEEANSNIRKAAGK